MNELAFSSIYLKKSAGAGIQFVGNNRRGGGENQGSLTGRSLYISAIFLPQLQEELMMAA